VPPPDHDRHQEQVVLVDQAGGDRREADRGRRRRGRASARSFIERIALMSKYARAASSLEVAASVREVHDLVGRPPDPGWSRMTGG
jgi:hypothetical protein